MRMEQKRWEASNKSLHQKPRTTKHMKVSWIIRQLIRWLRWAGIAKTLLPSTSCCDCKSLLSAQFRKMTMKSTTTAQWDKKDCGPALPTVVAGSMKQEARKRILLCRSHSPAKQCVGDTCRLLVQRLTQLYTQYGSRRKNENHPRVWSPTISYLRFLPAKRWDISRILSQIFQMLCDFHLLISLHISIGQVARLNADFAFPANKSLCVPSSPTRNETMVDIIIFCHGILFILPHVGHE